eukprot:4248739-Pleurochrysis_carterae.AAC.1
MGLGSESSTSLNGCGDRNVIHNTAAQRSRVRTIRLWGPNRSNDANLSSRILATLNLYRDT